ncbi:hypothetical protein ACIBFB_11290 [Nocardiopsis sp. NPDC050513]|uniref:hypothetical protein n=1 Tax=Nocardiopsis sp. NPDC050513 TaxID=3364338 RepID=UPI0037A6E62B
MTPGTANRVTHLSGEGEIPRAGHGQVEQVGSSLDGLPAPKGAFHPHHLGNRARSGS